LNLRGDHEFKLFLNHVRTIKTVGTFRDRWNTFCTAGCTKSRVLQFAYEAPLTPKAPAKTTLPSGVVNP
jgi:hypothetical protein